MKETARFVALLLLVLLGGLALRLPHLAERPMHADEAVQAAIFRQLWCDGRYRYDPHEYHGPTLPYATLPSVWIGRVADFRHTTEATFRIVPVCFGAGLILLVALLHDGLTRGGVLYAALLTAVSPAMVYYQRYYIHETLLVFFTLLALGAAWRYLRSGRVAWCLLSGLSAGLMQATKETSPLVFAAAGGGVALVLLLRLAVRAPSTAAVGAPPGLAVPLRERRSWCQLALALAAALLVVVTLFSSFGTNLRGPLDGLRAYLPWLQRAGGQSPHVHAWYYYLQILTCWHLADGPWWTEGWILLLAATALVASWLPGTRGLWRDMPLPLVRWLGCFAVLLTAAYSMIPYKTPWCLLGFLHALILLAGAGAVVLWRGLRPWPLRGLLVVALLAGPAQLAWQARRAAGELAADPRNPYVYAPTLPDATRLEDELQQLASGAEQELVVKVIWRDGYYWPLPWYLRRFGHVGYWTAVLPADPVAPIVIASPEWDAELTARLEATHLKRYYGLRPQVLAMVWVRMDLWEARLRRLGRL